MEKLIRAIEVGKKNKYNLPFVDFTDKQGKTTSYRFFYPSNYHILVKTIELVEASFVRPLEDFEYRLLVSFLWIVEHKSTEKNHSKLDGLKSISTSCLDNTFCLARMQNCTSICHDCYAGTQQERNLALNEHNLVNGIILRNVLIPVEYFRGLALFNEKFVRIESFGDVSNETQAENYIHIMQAFEGATFAVWTKNIFTWIRVFEKCEKPCNCVFIVSSCHKNVIASLREEITKYIDHVFTVYTEEFINSHGININCGGRACKECIAQGKRCYFKNTEYHISEMLK